MQYAYEKIMQEYDLTYSELPEDAKLGIDTIKNIAKAVNMAEKKGQQISSQTMAKIKANDKWVVREILDYVDDEDENADEIPHEDDEIIDEIQETDDANNPEKVLGFQIESELEKLYLTKQTQFTLDELKSVAPKSYNIIFENFEDDGDNGVETNRFELIETDENIFTLYKK